MLDLPGQTATRETGDRKRARVGLHRKRGWDRAVNGRGKIS
jgi:hypothetical protein